MPYVTQVAIGVKERMQVFGNDYPAPDGTGVRLYPRDGSCRRSCGGTAVFAVKNVGLVVNFGTG